MISIKKIIFAGMVAIITICGIVSSLVEKNSKENMEYIHQQPVDEQEQKAASENLPVEITEEIYIQVSGAVTNPGVYKVNKGTRVFEVIDIAGGFTEESDRTVVNQARVVVDEENIYFPTIHEVKSGAYSLDSKSHLININSASKEQLMTLAGIGEAKAKAIINYREKNGDFNGVEDIKKVSGIKDTLFESIKDQITD